jgi:hypothetical protein
VAQSTRRRKAAPTARAKPAPSSPRIDAATTDDGVRAISWRHCLIGLLAGEVTLLVLSNLGLVTANLIFGGDGGDGGIVGVSTLIAVIAGAFLAARLAGRAGLYQGIVVGIGFILIGAVFQLADEAHIVQSSLASHSHRLVDLGPMRMGDLISGDFLALFGGSVGGLLARRR